MPSTSKHTNTVEDDSSPGHEDYRAVEGDDAPEDNPGLTGLILILGENQNQRICNCGCGDQTSGRDFKQGHDAKLKGKLQRAHVRGDDVNLVKGGSIVTTDAMNIAAERGWERFLEKAEETAERRARRKTRRSPRSPIKGGNAALLADMKQAAAILKAIGRYGNEAGDRKIELTRGNFEAVLDGSLEELDRHESGLTQGQTIRINRRGWKDAMILEFKGDRAQVAYTTDGGNETSALVEVESILAWQRELAR